MLSCPSPRDSRHSAFSGSKGFHSTRTLWVLTLCDNLRHAAGRPAFSIRPNSWCGQLLAVSEGLSKVELSNAQQDEYSNDTPRCLGNSPSSGRSKLTAPLAGNAEGAGASYAASTSYSRFHHMCAMVRLSYSSVLCPITPLRYPSLGESTNLSPGGSGLQLGLQSHQYRREGLRKLYQLGVLEDRAGSAGRGAPPHSVFITLVRLRVPLRSATLRTAYTGRISQATTFRLNRNSVSLCE